MKNKKFGDLREFDLNDAGDKLLSNKEFIITQVRVQAVELESLHLFLKSEIVNSPQFTSFTLEVLIEETPDVLQI